jgi:hypothetical protein
VEHIAARVSSKNQGLCGGGIPDRGIYRIAITTAVYAALISVPT